VHELQVRAAGTIPLTGHDVPVDFIVTPDRVIDCRRGQGARPAPSIRWEDLTDEKVAAIPHPPPHASSLPSAPGLSKPGLAVS
jgi:5-formyltetrahydrofolate cyclo-ligase